MFGVLKCLNYLVNNYGVKFKELMTDNGPEFGRKSTNQAKKAQHPFERMLIELGIKHRRLIDHKPKLNAFGELLKMTSWVIMFLTLLNT